MISLYFKKRFNDRLYFKFVKKWVFIFDEPPVRFGIHPRAKVRGAAQLAMPVRSKRW